MTDHFPIVLQFKPDHSLWGYKEVYNPKARGNVRVPVELTEKRVQSMLQQLAVASGMGVTARGLVETGFSVGSIEAVFEKADGRDELVSVTFRSKHTWGTLWAETNKELLALGLTLEEVVAANKVAASLVERAGGLGAGG